MDNIKFWSKIVIWLAITAGLVLSVISYLKICTLECEAAHNYRILGMHFEFVGVIFFILLSVSFYLSRTFITSLLVASGVGAESMFIYVQKYIIEQWCPICISIATCVGIIAIALFINYLIGLKSVIKQKSQGDIMIKMWRGLGASGAFIIGFLVAFFGISKMDPLQAAENTIKNNISFGQRNGNIEVYIFTDWQCPACRKAEPIIESMAPAIERRATLYFVDFAIHPETLNFTPYNLSFMVNNKSKYLKLRHVLTKISEKTGSPTEEEVEKAIAPLGVTYKQLNYADVAVGIKFFKRLGKQFKIRRTPTIAIINTRTKKGKKLSGVEDINELKVMKAIDALR